MTLLVPQFTFADRLRKGREESGLSIDELAERAGRHGNTIRSWEKATRRPRDVFAVARLYEEHTGVPSEWFLTGEVRRSGS